MKSEGIRRLSLLVGFLGAVAAAVDQFNDMWTWHHRPYSRVVSPTLADYFLSAGFVALAAVVGFLVPWGLVRILGWVYLGFVVDRESPRDE